MANKAGSFRERIPIVGPDGSCAVFNVTTGKLELEEYSSHQGTLTFHCSTGKLSGQPKGIVGRDTVRDGISHGVLNTRPEKLENHINPEDLVFDPSTGKLNAQPKGMTDNIRERFPIVGRDGKLENYLNPEDLVFDPSTGKLSAKPKGMTDNVRRRIPIVGRGGSRAFSVNTRTGKLELEEDSFELVFDPIIGKLDVRPKRNTAMSSSVLTGMVQRGFFQMW